MVDGRCEGSVHSDITKAECCASVGQAWGSPCEKCPYAELVAALGLATALPFGPSIAPGDKLNEFYSSVVTGHCILLNRMLYGLDGSVIQLSTGGEVNC